MGNGYARSAEHHRLTRARSHVGHIDRFDVSVSDVRRQSAVATRARHWHSYTHPERVLFQSHVDRVGRGLSESCCGWSRLQGLHLRHTLWRFGHSPHIDLSAPQRSHCRENHQQRRFPRYGWCV